MVMKKIIVWILDDTIDKTYSDSDKIMKKYRYDFFLERWIEIVVINIFDYNIESKSFSRYKSQVSPKFDTVEWEIIPDIIRARTSKDRWLYISLLSNDFTLFPSPKTISVACDKRYTYCYFKEYQPLSMLMSQADDINTDAMQWNEVIIKPRRWSWWEWVKKIMKSDLSSQQWILNTEDYILQELCDFTKWYNESVTWIHDVRLVFIWWIFSYWSIRTNDSESEFRANVSQWWTSTYILRDQAPDSVFKLSEKLLNNLWWEKTWCVSFDWWFDYNSSSRKLIEMNFSPGFLKQDLLPGNIEFVDIAFDAYSHYFNDIMNK